MQRRKGRSYEQRIANVMREQWPGIEVRRSSQADRAHQSDVFVAVGPPKLMRLWLELQDARKPTPEAKLAQAERDISESSDRSRLPVVVWHRMGERSSYVTTRLWVLDEVRAEMHAHRHEVVTMPLEQFFDVLSGGVR
jgi:hypothetical protein